MDRVKMKKYDVTIEDVDASFITVKTNTSIRQEIYEHFSFFANGYQFHPSFKNMLWDGKIKLFNMTSSTIYAGLIEQVIEFCDDREYTCLNNSAVMLGEQVNEDVALDIAKDVNLPSHMTPRDYQIQYVYNALKYNRSLNLSPTSSGKSLIIYLVLAHYLKNYSANTLIIVPTIGLVKQMAGDLIDYGCDPAIIHQISSGADKNPEPAVKIKFQNTPLMFHGKDEVKLKNKTKKRALDLVIGDVIDDKWLLKKKEVTSDGVVLDIEQTTQKIWISTWHSLANIKEQSWFRKFDVVMGDEAHTFNAKSLTTIMENLTLCNWRHGFTGTISSDSKVNKLSLEGMFGPIKKYVSTKDLIDAGTVAEFKVEALILKYPEGVTKDFNAAIRKINTGTKRYMAEREFIANYAPRNQFICDLVSSLSHCNNLILFDLVEKHGKILEPLLRTPGRHLHFIHGAVDGDVRESVRKIVENDNIPGYTVKLDKNEMYFTPGSMVLTSREEKILIENLTAGTLIQTPWSNTDKVLSVTFGDIPNKVHDILASVSTFGTGTSIKRLDNVIFANSSKSEIRVLQPIGRVLRKGNGADDATLFDIADNLSAGDKNNYTLEHFKKRIEIYSQEGFKFKITNIRIK